ncbi:MAG: hypothetical protein GY720_06035 [bacterium]|nr:hypothetical protein [bacterium]
MGIWGTTCTPDESLPSTGGFVNDEVMWAALDCPGSFAASDPSGRPLGLSGSPSLEKATDIAREMVTRFGMTEALGFMGLTDGGDGFVAGPFGAAPRYSQETSAAIDEEVRQLLDNAQLESRTILEAHIDSLELMAADLLEHETLDVIAIGRILQRVPKRRRESGGAGVIVPNPDVVGEGAAA